MSDRAAVVLVVDDDATVREVARRYLERDGRVVLEADTGPAALLLAEAHHPDLVVLDLMLPELSGLQVCCSLRESSTVPIIMLTAMGAEADRVAGLEHGADDYMVKPFSPRELALRVTRILDRSRTVVSVSPVPISSVPASSVPARTLVDGDLVVDEAARTVRRGGAPLALTSREFDLLRYFLQHPGRVFSRSELMETVWQWTFGDQSTVTVHVRRLREKIELDPAQPTRIATVWGLGYRFDPVSGVS